MNASSREEVFNLLRQKGIKAIKVVAADGSKANGEIQGVRRRVVIIVSILLSFLSAITVYVCLLLLGVGNNGQTSTTKENANNIKTVAATPLPRQEIHGDRERIKRASNSFDNKVDLLFAKFAEPGRDVKVDPSQFPSRAEVEVALKEAIKISDSELTEVIDLKRIVAGIRREIRIYLQAGGSVDDFIKELFKRQNAEIKTRKKAFDRLSELLNTTATGGELKDAYVFWLQSNAQLASMGIHPIPIPEILRDYQKKINIEE